MAGFGKHQHCCGHSCVGFEDSAGHGDDRLQTVALHNLFANILVSLGGAKQHSVRHDHSAAAAYLQHPQEERQEQQLGLFSLAQFQQVGGHNICIQAPFERGIGQDQGILLPVGILITEAVPVFYVGVINAMGHHVHGADAEHGTVHIITMEHVVHIVILFHPVKEDFRFAVFLEIFSGSHQEPSCATGRVADHIIRLRGHHLHHHADNMPGRTELTVNAGSGDFGQEILVNIAPDICSLGLAHLIDPVHGRDNLVQHQRCRNLENSVTHVFGIGAVLISMEILDKRKYPLLHDRIHLPGGKVVEYRPFQLIALDGALTHLYLAGKNALVGQA